ncbi:MAG: hypothetical protein WBO07_09325 [Formosimonas sp.]|jgi:hypothetical protein
MTRMRTVVLIAITTLAAIAGYWAYDTHQKSTRCLDAGGAWRDGLCDMSAPIESPNDTSKP